MKQKLRIRGLVKTARYVQDRIDSGISDAEITEVNRYVKATLEQVTAICAKHNTTPDRLPSPSFKAFIFLNSLNGDTISWATNRPNGNSKRIGGVVTTAKATSIELTRCALHNGDISQLKATVAQGLRAIQRRWENQSIASGTLPLPSRQAYRFLQLLADPYNLNITLDFVRRCVVLLPKEISRPVDVTVALMRSLWRRQTCADRLVLRAHIGFIHAPEKVIESLLIDSCGTATKASRELLERYSESQEFKAIAALAEDTRPSDSSTVDGQHHSLDESFQRINRAHFLGKMEKPNLEWTKRETIRTFGHYNAGTDRVTVSISLDRSDVPQYVVDHVMYHELLHRLHGATWKNGRRNVHTAAFRVDERKFKRHSDATDHLKAIAHRARRH